MRDGAVAGTQPEHLGLAVLHMPRRRVLLALQTPAATYRLVRLGPTASSALLPWPAEAVGVLARAYEPTRRSDLYANLVMLALAEAGNGRPPPTSTAPPVAMSSPPRRRAVRPMSGGTQANRRRSAATSAVRSWSTSRRTPQAPAPKAGRDRVGAGDVFTGPCKSNDSPVKGDVCRQQTTPLLEVGLAPVRRQRPVG